jgi:hypothetical protein
VVGVITERDGTVSNIKVTVTAPDHRAAFALVNMGYDIKESELEAWRVDR